MSLPIFEEKYDESAFMTPEDRLDHRYDESRDRPTVPDTIVLTFQQYLFEDIAARDDAEEIDLETGMFSLYALGDAEGDIGVVGDFGIGVPTLAIIVEELIALGARLFCIVGGCATLQSEVSPGEVVIADRAIRDEGTSYHYLEPAETVAATPALVTELQRQADADGIGSHTGTTWTTDAFYRETNAEIDHYTAEDVLTVEMEAAALFAIAQYRDVMAGAIFTPFDRLTDDHWTWDVPTESPEERLRHVFSLAVTAGANTLAR
ncbi:MAG: uridine phosphorylase [Natronomonas sp.]|jgi:uridine phosphorylase